MVKYLLVIFVSFWHIISYANDQCTDAIQLVPGTAITYTYGSFSGTTISGPAPACATTASQDLWYKFTATDSTMSILLSDVSGLNHGFELIQGGCGGTVLQCINANGSYNYESYFNNNFIPGQVYFVRVFNVSSALSTATFGITIRKYPTPANDLCVNATTLTPTPGTTITYTDGTFNGAMMNGGTPACAPASSQDVWYKFTATDSTMSILLNEVSGLNHGFELIQGGCNGTVLQCINANGAYNYESYFNNNFIPGQVYYVRVLNTSSALSTLGFGISIRKYPTPVNDLCANATVLTPNATCTYTNGTFNGAMMNGGTPACGTGTSQDVWYKFTATDSTMSITLNEVSGLNHGFEIIQGSCNGTVLQCINANGTYSYENYFNNNFIPGQVYYIRVFNTSSALSTLGFGICIRNFPNPVNDLCANATLIIPNNTCTYTNGTFSGAMMNGGASACATASSQDVWYKFTATDTTMSITLNEVSGLNHAFEIIQGGCNGTVTQCINVNGTYSYENYFNNNFIPGQLYYVRVLNTSPALNISSFGICVRNFPNPSNDRCVNATEIIPSTACNYINGTFSGALLHGGPAACGTTASQDVWYKFTATDKTMSITLNEVSGLNHGFEIIQGSCNGTVLQCVNENGSYNYENYFNNNFIPGQVYYVRVFNASPALIIASFGICIRKFPSPVNDVCASALELTPYTTCNYTGGTFSGAMLDGGTPSCGTTTSQDVWYKFVATTTNMTVTLNSVSGVNHGFQLFEGSCSGTQIACVNQAGLGNPESSAFNSLTVGQTYFVRVINVSSSLIISNFSICLVGTHPTTCTPAIQLIAPSTSICLGESITFNAIATHGGPSPAYQWKVNGSIVGSNSPSYTTSTLSNGANISCILTSNAVCASAINTTSNSITMVVSPTLAPAFTQIAAICSGASLSLPTTSNNGVSGTWSPAVNNTATTTYTFTPYAGQCASTTTMTVTVNSGTAPAFTQIQPVCFGTSFTLPTTSNNGINGTWSPAINNAQTTTYTFTPNAGGPCAFPTTMTVTVYRVTPAFNQISAICPGGSISLPTTSTNGIIGTWSPAVNNMVTTTYTFTPNSGQCATTTTMTVSVNSATPTFNQVPAICSGGSFSLPTSSTNGIIGTWSPAINNTATTTYTFTPNAGQCASATTMTVSVNNTSIVPAFTQIQAICTGGSFTLPTSSINGINGTWSPAINNTATTTYTFTPTAGQCASTTTMTVTVNSTLVTPTFTLVPAICPGASFTLPTSSTNGITGTWSPAINNVATTTYTFTPNVGQCASTKTMTVTVNSNSTIPAFTQVQPICAGGSFTLPTSSTNGIIGTWSPAINNAATTTYTFTPNTGQCALTTTMTVTVNNNSIIPAFTQVAAVCSGTSFTLPTSSTNGINGTWSPAVNNMATTTYTFTPASGQCALTTTMTVTVNNNTTPAFTQIPAVCSGTAFTLPAMSNNGINGTWSPAANNTATTTYTFTPTSGQCVGTASMTVVVNSVNASVTTQGNTITASATGATYRWINCSNSQQINGATNASFTPTENGSYAVIVTQNGCSETSNCITISTLGLETLTENGWKVYPNPATDQLFIELSEGTEMVITDMTGKTIQSEILTSGNNIVNVSSLTAGVYFIQSASGANMKFVKK